MGMPPFHLAFPVLELEATRHFYTHVLGCNLGREAETWIDFDFFGHQISAHLVARMTDVPTNLIDGKAVPSSHFGAVLDWDDWQKLSERLKDAGTKFLIEPYIRFKGLVGEQATMFITDPSGNGLEFKAFKNKALVFAR
jgi:uncharacterized protein